MKKDKRMLKLPAGWIETTLGEILFLEYGKSLPQRIRVESGKYPVYGSNGKVGNHNDYIIKGPIIIVGRKGSVGAVHYEKENCWPIDTTYYIKCCESLNSKFLFYLLRQLNLGILDKSTAIPGINRNNIYIIPILLPPLNEQHRIVAKIEELFSELDHSVINLKKAKQQLKVYRQALLKNAFEGKLTEKWREVHKDQLSKWKLETLKNLCETITDGDHQAPPKVSQGIPFLVISNIRNGMLDFDSETRFVPQKYYEAIKESRKPKKNDILYSVTGSFGIPVLVDTERKFCFQRHIALLKPNKSIYNKFLLFALKSSLVFEQAKAVATGTAQLTVPLAGLRKITVPVPSISEQKKIVEEIERQLSLADEMEKTINQSLKQAKHLRQSILKKAFEGTLVPQDSNDEDGIILLQKIQKEKENYLITQKIFQEKKPKRRLSMKSNKSIIEILEEVDSPIEAKDIWLKSKHKNDIDAFYAELKELEGKIKVKAKGKESFIGLKR